MCSLQTMLNDDSWTHTLRNRKFQLISDSPSESPYLNKSETSASFDPVALSSPGRLKPLPPVPIIGFKNDRPTTNVIFKPLPAPPRRHLLRYTLYWIAGFCLWFLFIVVLLPVITEKDAMPGFNRWLRSPFRTERPSHNERTTE